MTKHPSIFILVPAYRDPECFPTLVDIFKKAKYPDRIFPSVCWQSVPDLDADMLPRGQLHKNVTVQEFHVNDSHGVCWARNTAQKVYNGEDYALYIDSHSRFIPGWDELIIEELQKCPADRPVLASYPAGYTPPDSLELNATPTVMRPHPFTPGGDIRFRGVFLSKTPEKSLRGAFVAGGFLFTRGEVVREAPNDPYLYFGQEEVILSARLWTHGYDIYHPPKHYLFHYYNMPNDKQKRALHWEDRRDWETYLRRGQARANHLTGHQFSTDPEALKDLDKHGFGTARTFASFEEFTGIDFKTRTVNERGLRCHFIEGLENYMSGPVYIPEIDGAREKA
ncbi:MAG: GlcNAc-transferase family protein [Alphaproteobacteria bacterium]